ncbi:PREDICTED: glutathione S-transferase U11-like [Tarenaya hassleriana]|uniref:glutathione S-transferase U11-like n=1 Tax=Tarenaya hassleriana TaxID=28532 RepID=UPI00053C5DA7|nr:PREDICTED: glutathione S-transferase U11-like [Tarenaya hassleriana]
MAQNGLNDLKLIGAWPSPFVLRARIALNLKGLDYEFLEEDILSSKSDLLLKYNPIHKKIPVLIHCGKPICESLNIVQYIDEVWSADHAILPSKPFDRAVARFWDMYIDEHCYTSINGVAGAKGDGERMAAVEKLQNCLALLEEAFQKCSKGREFFGGDEIGFIDIGLGSMLSPLRVVEKFSGVKFLNPTKTPGLFRWANRFCAHDAVKHVIPDVERLAAFAMLKFNRQD